MKRLLAFSLMTAVAVLMTLSCKETLPNRFHAFVEKVEKKADTFSQNDWNEANAQFEKLVQEYRENKDSFNKEEQKQIRSDIMKYAGLVARSGLDTVIGAFDEFMEQIPQFFDGIGDFLRGLGLETPDETE